MTEEEQRALLAQIEVNGDFGAPVPEEETSEEAAARKAFEQRALRSGGARLREMGGRMGLLPELVLSAWKINGDVLAQVVIHAYRSWGLRLSENIDVVYSKNAVAEAAKPEEEKPVSNSGDESIWDDFDNDDFAGTESTETKSEEPPKKDPPKKAPAKGKPSKAERPAKDASEAKIDSMVKAAMQASADAQATLKAAELIEKRLKAIHEQTTATQRLVNKLDLSFDQLMGGTIRTMQIVSGIAKVALPALVEGFDAKGFLQQAGGAATKVIEKFQKALAEKLDPPKGKK